MTSAIQQTRSFLGDVGQGLLGGIGDSVKVHSW